MAATVTAVPGGDEFAIDFWGKRTA